MTSETAESQQQKPDRDSVLTLRQMYWLRKVDRFIQANGFPPTRRELHRHPMGPVSVFAVLQRKGCIECGFNSARAIRITEKGRQFLGGEVFQASAGLIGKGFVETAARCSLCGTVHFRVGCPKCGG